jgi:hypothetical protein
MPSHVLDAALRSSQWPAIHVGPLDDVDTWMLAAGRPAGTSRRAVRGKCCTTRRGLLREWSSALQFPSYFGENWDAFEECLTDLEWIGATQIAVVVTEAHRLSSLAAGDRTTFLSIIRDATRGRGNRRGLRVVFHAEPRHEHALRKMLMDGSPR